jgi:HEAT repeat protein
MNKRRFESLLRNLQHQDPFKRRAAAEALGEGDVRAVYPLIRALHDDNYGVQDAAIHSLMKIRNEATAYMILPLLRGNAFLRNTAIIILREMNVIAVPLLRELLKDKDDDIRKFALDLIYDIQKCDYEAEIKDLLENDRNANVRASAAKALGRLGYKKALNSLLRALHDDEWVAFSALEALSDLKIKDSVGPIADLLTATSESLRYAAAETLGKIPSQKAVDTLMSYFARSEAAEKPVILKSLIRLGAIPDDKCVEEILISMLGDSDWETCSAAVSGLSIIKSVRSIRSMIDMAGAFDPSIPEHEEKISFIMNSVEAIGCEDELISLLDDDSIRYRGKSIAIECVGNLRCKKAVPALIELLNSNLRDVRRSSIKSIGMIDGVESRDLLIGAITDPDSHVRKSAVISLGKIGDIEAFEPMMEMLKAEKYSDVIDELIRALFLIDAETLGRRKNELHKDIQARIDPIGSDLTRGAAAC